MKFEVNWASRKNKPKTVEIDTLEELIAFHEQVRSPLILRSGHITVYDGYIE